MGFVNTGSPEGSTRRPVALGSQARELCGLTHCGECLRLV